MRSKREWWDTSLRYLVIRCLQKDSLWETRTPICIALDSLPVRWISVTDQSAEELRPQIILDGDLSPERLDAYLVRDREEDELDFKLNLGIVEARTSREKLSMVKDAIALANTLGGYLIYGVSENEMETPRFSLVGLTDSDRIFFDPTDIKSLLERYIRRRVQVSCAVVESKVTPGRYYGAIYVERFGGGFAIPIEAEGQYQDEASGRSQTIFSRGEIWVRRGAQSIRAQAEDLERLESDFRRREQAQWLEQHFQLSKLIEALQRSTSQTATTHEISDPTRETLLAESAPLRTRLIEILASENDVLIRLWLGSPRQQIGEVMGALPRERDEQSRIRDFVIVPLLDALQTMAIICIEFAKEDYYRLCIDELSGLYEHFSRAAGNQEWPDSSSAVSAVGIWTEITERIFIIGAALVKYRRFSFIPYLVEQTPYQDDYWIDRVYWARHSSVMLHRSGLMGGSRNVSICELARPLALSLGLIPALFESEEEFKTLVSQFDFLQSILGTLRNNNVDDIFPNFAVYHRSRTEGLVKDLIRGGQSRSALPKVGDDVLGNVINKLDQYASKIYIMSGWSGHEWTKGVQEWLANQANP